jgi:hypothetical protein
LTVSSEYFCKGRFSRAISTDQPNFVSRANPEIDSAHQGSGTNSDLKVFDTEHWANPLLGVMAKALVYNREKQKKMSG